MNEDCEDSMHQTFVFNVMKIKVFHKLRCKTILTLASLLFLYTLVDVWSRTTVKPPTLLFHEFAYDGQLKRTKNTIGGGACKILDADPYDPRFSSFKRKATPVGCEVTQEEFILSNLNGTISYNTTLLDHYKKKKQIIKCYYREAYTKGKKGNAIVFLSNIGLHRSAVMFSEAVHYFCSAFDNKLDNNFSLMSENLVPILRKKMTTHRRPQEKPNVLFLGVHSLSKLKCIRDMPKVCEYLKKILKAHTFQLLVKSGSNANSNIMALVTGKGLDEKETENYFDTNNIRDGYNFIWKDFSKEGYMTAIGENLPSSSMFTEKQNSLIRYSTDHSMRNFWLAREKLKNNPMFGNMSKIDCIMDKSISSKLFYWITNVMRLYPQSPVFGFVLDASPQLHAGELQLVQEPLLKALQTLHEERLLDNTILFVFGDHGNGTVNSRKTWWRGLEGDLPFFSVVLPEWLKEKHPHLENILSYNQDRLTTWLDIHATLKDVLKEDFGNSSHQDHTRLGRGLSIFKRIPINRSCRDAGIQPRFCPCVERETKDFNAAEVQVNAKRIVEYINKKTQGLENVCARLQLEGIKKAEDIIMQTDDGSKWKKVTVGLRLVVKTLPYHGIFETILDFDPELKNYDLNGQVERVDAYEKQGKCANDPLIERFCHCLQ